MTTTQTRESLSNWTVEDEKRADNSAKAAERVQTEPAKPRKAPTEGADPNVQAAIEASDKFIAEHPEVPTVEVDVENSNNLSKTAINKP